MKRSALAVVLACVALVLAPAAPATAQAGGFAGPVFGLDTAPDGSLVVPDSGAGVVTLRHGQRRLTALPGVSDVSTRGFALAWATRMGSDTTADSGQALVRVVGGRPEVVANLFAFEAAHDPDGRGVDSNPFDVEALSGASALVVDAGGNDLLRVDRRGAVEVVATFPDEVVSTDHLKSLFGCPAGPPMFCGLPPQLPAQPVPTSVAVAPDGSYYVGELKGFPAPVGESRIWRVASDASGAECGQSPDCELVFDGGFTSVIDLVFGRDGDLYVAELDEATWAAVELLQAPTGGTVSRCDVESGTCTAVAGDLDVLTGIALGRRGELWGVADALAGPTIVRVD